MLSGASAPQAQLFNYLHTKEILLVERARRDFSAEHEAAGIMRLCKLVEGMPLTLELAAIWTKVLSCADIADEI